MQAISALRAAASHAPDDLPFLSSTGSAQIANADSNGIAFSRSPAQVGSLTFPVHRVRLRVIAT